MTRRSPRQDALRLGAPLLAAALGVAHAIAFAPWSLPWLQLAALCGLFAMAARAPSWRAAALYGFAFGLGWFGFGVSWVYISMHTYGGMPALLAGAATAGFCAFLALYPALALALTQRAAPTGRLLLLLPASWTVSEWLRGWLFTGFPWLASGYAHSDGPLAGWAPLVGVHGITLIAAFIAGAVAVLLTSLRRSRGAAVAGALLAVVLLGGGQALRPLHWTQPQGQPIAVRLAQGNVPQDIKFAERGLQRAIDIHLRLLQGPHVDLAVLPESVFPVPLNYLPDSLTEALLRFVRGGSALVFGVFIEEPGERYFNSAVGLRTDGAEGGEGGAAGRPPLQRYSKRHLVPFGEFIPWGFRWFVDLMQMPIGDQERGPPYQEPMQLAGQRIAVNICYEDLFGAEIITAWQVPERAPTMLLNLSNLAWFDDSIALDQHLQISRLRALETGRPMLRATNTGATAVIDARGNVTARLPYRVQGALDAQVQGYTGTTPYVRFGDTPALALSFLLLAIGVAFGRRR